MFGSRFYGNAYFGPRYWGNGAVAAVEVPDVANDEQAAGTAELEAADFVVAVLTEYSSIVPAGFIISQDPVGGSFAPFGSTVTITVSLGDAPVAEGGKGGADPWEFDYNELKRLRARAREKRLAREAETARIESMLDRAIAVEERKIEAVAERAEVLTQARRVAETVSTSKSVPQRVRKAAQNAYQTGTRASLEKFEKELRQMMDDEESLILMLLLDD